MTTELTKAAQQELEVSDAEIVEAIIESGGSAMEGLPSNWDAGDIAVSPAQLVSGVRAILALRKREKNEMFVL